MGVPLKGYLQTHKHKGYGSFIKRIFTNTYIRTKDMGVPLKGYLQTHTHKGYGSPIKRIFTNTYTQRIWESL